MSNSENVNAGAQKDYLDSFTRERVLECPHFMVLLGYLAAQHNLPKYGWRNDAPVYHYTDANGLLGIIENNRLWASDVFFLNDPSETRFFPDFLFSTMENKKGGLTIQEQEIIDLLKRKLNNSRPSFQTLCISLSRSGDLLSQWRGYGNFGKGYAVEFQNTFELIHPQLGFFYDVCYGDMDISDFASDLLAIMSKSFAKWQDDLVDDWARVIQALAIGFKDNSYAEEKESRIVVNYSEERDRGPDFSREAPLCFRARGSDIVPYIPLCLKLIEEGEPTPKLPIRRVIAGPGVNFESNYHSIIQLLQKNGYDGVAVEKSAIPFRP